MIVLFMNKEYIYLFSMYKSFSGLHFHILNLDLLSRNSIYTCGIFCGLYCLLRNLSLVGL